MMLMNAHDALQAVLGTAAVTLMNAHDAPQAVLGTAAMTLSRTAVCKLPVLNAPKTCGPEASSLGCISA